MQPLRLKAGQISVNQHHFQSYELKAFDIRRVQIHHPDEMLELQPLLLIKNLGFPNWFPPKIFSRVASYL